jgi:uncharacterized repeat protein (TIGR03806 family)
MIWRVVRVAAAACLAFLGGCGLVHHDVHSYVQEPFPKKLSEWHLYTSTRNGLVPNSGVVPYDLNTPLFSDYASKHRFVWMPPGSHAEYRDDGPLEFPAGTILSKSFAFPMRANGDEKLIETRLLVKTAGGWVPLPYVWNDSQTEATLELVPDPAHVSWTDGAGRHRDFSYHIPNTNECRQCHDHNRELQPIGVKARNLNRDYDYGADGRANQITHWASVGYLQGAPVLASVPRAARWNDPASGSLDDRAHAYLDNNCAHCHQPGGAASYSGVDFRYTQRQLGYSGLCKAPASAGDVGRTQYDLVPGHPDDSVMLYRMESSEPKVMMPQFGRTVVHEEGVALIRDWITTMPPQNCM